MSLCGNCESLCVFLCLCSGFVSSPHACLWPHEFLELLKWNRFHSCTDVIAFMGTGGQSAPKYSLRSELSKCWNEHVYVCDRNHYKQQLSYRGRRSVKLCGFYGNSGAASNMKVRRKSVRVKQTSQLIGPSAGLKLEVRGQQQTSIPIAGQVSLNSVWITTHSSPRVLPAVWRRLSHFWFTVFLQMVTEMRGKSHQIST